jgi:hypothetical protein
MRPSCNDERTSRWIALETEKFSDFYDCIVLCLASHWVMNSFLFIGAVQMKAAGGRLVAFD